MKIAITGDFHLGFSDDALPQARNALLAACPDADAIVVAGDLFDTRIPRQETLNEALQLFAEAASAMGSNVKMLEITADGKESPITSYPAILAIHGTHERRSKGLANPIHILDSALAAVNVHTRIICVEKDGERVCFQGMGGVPEEFAKQALSKLAFSPVKATFNVFIFHQSLEEAMPFGEAISSEDLPAGFDLYVDGHIHWMTDVKAQGKRILIPGSTVVTQMRKNEMRQKSVIMFDTKTSEFELRPFQTRTFIFQAINFDPAASGPEVVTAVEDALEGIASKVYSQTPVVKLKLTGLLAKGLRPADLDFSLATKRHSEKMKIHIDRDFEPEDLERSPRDLQDARSDAKNVRELSVALFIDALKRRDITLSHPDAEELLDALCEEDTGKAAKLI